MIAHILFRTHSFISQTFTVDLLNTLDAEDTAENEETVCALKEAVV